jgi:malonyl-CoA/methylmalonyl-CoA synthetase
MFLDLLLTYGRSTPEKPCLEFVAEGKPAATVRYGELLAQIEQTAASLVALGVQPGDRVAWQLPKTLDAILVHLATMNLGAISLPLNPAYPPDELRYFLEDAGACLLFAAAATQPHLDAILDHLPTLKNVVYLSGDSPLAVYSPPTRHSPLATRHSPHTTALMIYTSGTTGRPKGAEITHGNLTAQLDALHEAWGWQAEDVLLHVLPIFHVHGLVVALHGALHAGATAVLLPRFEPEMALQTLVQRRCTLFMAVPTIHRRLVQSVAQFGKSRRPGQSPRFGKSRHDLGHLRLITSGSDRLPDDLFYAFRETFGHTILERYGLTETGMNLSNPLHGERRAGSVGFPLPGVEARIADPASDEPLADGEVGEVQVRGAHVFKGYWRQEEKTAAAFAAGGWFRTGDLGLRQADGTFELKGRAKDLIITGGLNVYPPEIELVLAAHPGVEACAVIGCPDDEWGERIVAVVVRKEGVEVTAGALINFCREHLVHYKAPRQVHFVDALPRNAMGKVQKAELRNELCPDEERVSAVRGAYNAMSSL